MLKNSECFFCREIEDHAANDFKKSRIVYETKNFVVFPTKGCFKIGYLLIMPKGHFLSFADLNGEMIAELEAIIQRIANYLKQIKREKFIIFEHGTRDLSKLTSTSIMHAHIHIIPLDNDLISFLPDYCELKKIKGFDDLKSQKDNYLFLRDQNGNNYIVKNENYPSQFFRQIVCKSLGIDRFWNWRIYPFLENMEITIDYYSGL